MTQEQLLLDILREGPMTFSEIIDRVLLRLPPETLYRIGVARHRASDYKAIEDYDRPDERAIRIVIAMGAKSLVTHTLSRLRAKKLITPSRLGRNAKIGIITSKDGTCSCWPA